MEHEVARIVAEVLELNESEIRDDLTRRDVDQWDSLRHLTLIAALEEELGLRFSMEEIQSIAGIGSLKALIRRKTTPE